METKVKIKLLADLQAAIDNEDLKKTIESLPSGQMIWQITLDSLNAELEHLLSGSGSKKSVQTATDLDVLLSKIDRSLVIQMLKSIDQKLSTEAARPAAPPRPSIPEEPPMDQAEMQREWERQQLANLPKTRGRGSVAGPF